MVDATPESEVPVIVPLTKPVSLIPVGLKEAGLDSPTFRASAAYLSETVDAVEKWLDGLIKTSTKLSQEAATLAPLLTSFAAHCKASQNLSEAILDHDYTLLALRRLSGGGAEDFWLRAIDGIRKTQSTVAEPIKLFLQTEVRPFKDARRALENTQKTFDAVLLRYAGQYKTKEASSLREDAFQVHEARRAYLRASMDFCVLSPQLRAALDTLLIKISYDQWQQMGDQGRPHDKSSSQPAKEMNRIRSWSKQMSEGERYLRNQLLAARRQIEEDAERVTRPSRELDAYATSTVAYLGSGPSATAASGDRPPAPASKQGWLFLRTLTGKPTRTHWLRRWFFVKNGIFGCLVHGARSGGVEESEKVGVLLCGVKPAFQEDRRFCFEVKTKDTNILLQAETQDELMDWLSAFEKVKQKAIEEPAVAEAVLASSGNPSSDAAFAVSPAISQELATKRPDGQITTMTEDPNASLLSVEGESNLDLGSRSSFDVSALRKQASDRENEGSRDPASRILQKLDIHRKTNTDSQASAIFPESHRPSGGITSLIAASHAAMPIGPGRLQPAAEARNVSGTFSSSLAPASLINPPSTTNLTKTAIRVGVDRGLDLGAVDENGGIPSSLMANSWGSANWGYRARLERGEVDISSVHVPSPIISRRASDPTEDGMGTPISPQPPPSPQPDPVRHHKSASVMSLPGIQESSSSTDYPTYYPTPLRAHDAQFRMIFPNVSHTERVVMVFRASWNLEGGQNLPGRIFVTAKELYFYSNHMGLVLVSGAALENISEIDGTKDRDNDMLHLHLIDRNGREDELTLRIFLDSPRLVQQRLEYLVSNSVSANVQELDSILDTLVRLEVDSREDAPQSDSENVPSRQTSRRTAKNKTQVKLDRSLLVGGDVNNAIESSDNTRFRLPAQPVKYVPLGMSATPTTEKLFDVSAKVLIHVIFGDKSAVCPVLYQKRGAKSIKQHPWSKEGDDGPLRRGFEYEIDPNDSRSDVIKLSVMDTQSLDIASDRLCYLVTDLKVPVHLPMPKDYTLVSKIAITYETKSRCKLSIYTKVDWINIPWFSKSLIERRALEDLELEALSMTALVSEQVQLLGLRPTTKRAVDIYGNIGQRSKAARVSSKHEFPISSVSLRKRTVAGLFMEDVSSLFQSCCTTVLMSVIGVFNIMFKSISAHFILVILLLASLTFSTIQSSDFAKSWWQDRSTANFMARLGVSPNVHMSKSIYLRDIAEGSGSTYAQLWNSSSQCSNTFSDILANTNVDGPILTKSHSQSSSTLSTARRLKRTRQRLATYRHDILVALRLVNSIERETTQAEYENWLLDEAAMCERMSSLLRSPNRGASSPKQTDRDVTQEKEPSELVQKLGAADAEKVQQWYVGYCESCRSEQLRLGMRS